MADDLNKELNLDVTIRNVNKLVDETTKLNNAVIQTNNAITKSTNTRKQSNTALQQSQKVTSQLDTSTKKLQESLTKENTALSKGTTELKKKTTANSKLSKSTDKATKSTNGLTKSMAGSIAKIGFAISIIGLLVKGFLQWINLHRNLQEANSKLASVLRVTTKETSALQKEQLRLGGTTSKTANEVAELQYELAKMGFTQQQIIDSTEAVIFTSDALGISTSETAKLIGGTTRAFGLQASESKRVADVLTASTLQSSLDFSQLSTSISKVAPSSKAMGVSLERTTALLGVLSNNSIEASTSGSQLRNIFGTLAQQGLSYNDAMVQIQGSINPLKTSIELFGKEAGTIALVLARNTEMADELEVSLGNAGGTAERVANEQLDNLNGSLTKLGSAWEGFLLSLSSGNGIFKTVIDNVSEFLQLISQSSKEVRAYDMEVKRLTNRSIELNGVHDLSNKKYVELAGRSKVVADVTKALTEEIGRLKAKSNDLRDSLSTEAYDVLATALNSANKSTEYRLELVSGLSKKERERVITLLQNKDVLIELRAKVDSLTKAEKERLRNLEQTEANLKNKTEQDKKTNESLQELLRTNRDAIELDKQITEQKNILATSTTTLNEKLEAQKTLGALLIQQADTNIKNKKDEITAIDTQIAKDGETAELVKAKIKATGELSKLENGRATQLVTNSEAELKIVKETEDEVTATSKKGFNDRLKIINDEVSRVKGSEEEKLKYRIEALEELLKDEKLSAEERLEVEKQLKEDKEDLADVQLENEEKIAKETKKIRNKAFMDSLGAIADYYSVQAQIVKRNTDEELESLRIKHETGRISSEEYEKQSEKIKKDGANEEAKLQRKQAIAEKAQAIAGIGINTAQGIGFAIKTANLPLGILIGALGAAQVGIVLRTPIPPLPKYEKGTNNAKSGLAIYGEKGSELVVNKDGSSYLTPDIASYGMLQGGEKIYDHKQTMSMLNDKKDGISSQMLLELKKANRKENTVNTLNITEKGLYLSVKKGKAVRNILNKHTNGKN